MRLLAVVSVLVLAACSGEEPTGEAPADPVEDATSGEVAGDGAASGDADGEGAAADERVRTGGGIGPRDGAGSASDDGYTPTPDVERAVKALSVRHPEPACADVEALVDDPVATFRAIVEHVEMPPWAPMRAASCLLALHPAEAEADAIRWVSDPERAGLTSLVVGQLDGLPLERARRIGRAAVDGPHADIARQRLERLRSPELRAIAAP